MDFTKISYTEVTESAKALKTSASQMKEILDNIKTEFNKIGNDRNNVWTGTAATDTKADFDKLSAKFPEFSTAVTDCADYLDKVVANFKEVEKKIMGK